MKAQLVVFSLFATIALVIAGFEVFVAPKEYYDYKVQQCTLAQLRANLTEPKFNNAHWLNFVRT